VNTTDLIWANGELVPWEDAKVHVLTHALHYGTGVFEGIRAYETDQGPAVFRHREHLDRLEKSARLYYMDVPYSIDELREATHELIARSGLRSCYIRPLVVRGYGPMGLYPLDNPVEVYIAVWEWGAYLGEEGKLNGVSARTSSYRRISADSLIPHAKASGQYLNSVLAKIEASKSGYDEAILLDQRGVVSEGTGENVFVVREGVIATPLEGVEHGPPEAPLHGRVDRRALLLDERLHARVQLLDAALHRHREERQDLLGVLVWTVGVRAARDRGVRAEGSHRGEQLEIAARFRRAVRARRQERIVFA